MRSTKIAFIATVFNEESTLDIFLQSILSQTKFPDEIIIVDGGSTDATVKKLGIFKNKIEKKKVKCIISSKIGNRSVGRNEAIKLSHSDIILCSDAGNILDKNWIKNIIHPFKDKSIDVVAGYYKGKAKNVFQKCLIPYALVMPDKIHASNFLPATRSIAFTKKIWAKAGKFNEQFSHNEDYVFAHKVKAVGAKIVFVKDAIVYWIPRETYRQAFWMFYRFAFGDAEAGIYRSKVLFLILRYLFFIGFLQMLARYKSHFLIPTGLIFLSAYICWSIYKNYKYIRERDAFTVLPRLQLVADAAVIVGTLLGSIKKLLILILKYKALTGIIVLYVSLVSLNLPFGTPNPNHPFLYNMDEWHQLMAIKAIIKYGTTTIPGAAQIPFLYPVLSGIYLIPWTLLGIIDPFSIKSPFDNLMMQQRLFEVLRSVNFIFGIGSIILVAKISVKNLKISYIFPAFFLAMSPVFWSMSGYFKYDIGLLFFILLCVSTMFDYAQTNTPRAFIYAAVAAGLAMAVKFSAITLVLLLVIAYFWFNKNYKKDFKQIYYGATAYLITFVLFGIPNLLIGKADYRDLLYSNLVANVNATDVLNLPIDWRIYMPLFVFPFSFGHIFYFLTIIGTVILSIYFIYHSHWKRFENKNSIFLIFVFISFLISLYPLNVGAASNRDLVLAPFLALIFGVFIEWIFKNVTLNTRKYIAIAVLIVVLAQIGESIVWLQIKLLHDPQLESSVWVQKNIAHTSVIGIENIPIYQALPQNILNEFYIILYRKPIKTYYRYAIVDPQTKKLPQYIILTQDNIHRTLFKHSEKLTLMDRIQREGYKKIITFTPEFSLYHYFGTTAEYYFSALSSSPESISIYKK